MLGCWQVNHLSHTRSITNPGRTTAPTTAKNQRQPLPAPLILETPKPSTNPTTNESRHPNGVLRVAFEAVQHYDAGYQNAHVATPA